MFDRSISVTLALLLFACGGAGREGSARSTPGAAPGSTAGAEDGPPIAPIPNARRAVPGIVTGGVPTPEQLTEAGALGYRTVVSFIPGAESSAEPAQTEAAGMRWVSIPVAGAADLSEARARQLGEVLDAPGARPAILHCGSGNRASAMLALYLHFVEGVPPERALELGIEAGLRSLQPRVRELLGLPPAP